MVVGFREQTAAVSVGIHALIRRAAEEGTSVIIEGAHIVPGFVDFEPWQDRVLAVPVVISVDDAWYSYTIQETSEQSPWRPLLWPFRASVPLAALLFMVQGVSESLKCWYQIRFDREFEHREKVEV